MTDYLRIALVTKTSASTPHSSQSTTGTTTLAALNHSASLACKSSKKTWHLTSVNPWQRINAQQCNLYSAVMKASHEVGLAVAMSWGQLIAKDQPLSGGHHVTSSAFWAGLKTHISTPLKVFDYELLAPQLSVELYQNRPSEYDLLFSEMLLDASGTIDLDEAAYIPSGLIEWGGRKLTELPSVPLISGVLISVKQPAKKDKDLIAPWGISTVRASAVDAPYKTDPPIIEPGKIPAANAKKVHTVLNSISVTAYPTGEPLSVADVRIDADLDTYSWRLTCDVLNEGSLALLRPDVHGDKELLVEINGHRFKFFIANYSETKRIDDDKLNQAWRVTGYSRSQYLAAPYAPKRTRSMYETTAVQAAQADLFGTGFVLDWDTTLLPDWTMPNAAFSYQSLTPLEVIKKLASAVGGVVLADSFSDIIYVRPRYKAAAWALWQLDMDRAIHESQLLSMSNQRVKSVAYNAVVVCGESDGCILNVTRLGTAGDTPAPDVTDAWLTDIPANTARGIHELSASGDRMTYTHELTIPENNAQPGLLLPGMTVAVLHDDSSKNYRAFVQSVAITAAGRGNASITQTVSLDRPLAWEAV